LRTLMWSVLTTAMRRHDSRALINKHCRARRFSRPMLTLRSLPFFLLAALLNAQQPAPKYPNYPSETPAKFQLASNSFDYIQRDVMIPMRDGVRLHTIVLVPKG